LFEQDDDDDDDCSRKKNDVTEEIKDGTLSNWCIHFIIVLACHKSDKYQQHR